MDPQLNARIRDAVAQRSAELGGRGLITAAEVTVALDEQPVAPGCRLFTARWGAGQHQGALSGLIRDDDPPDTYPGQAMAKLFARWSESDWPDAPGAAAAVALLLDPEGRNKAILLASDAPAAAGSQLPELLRLPDLDGPPELDGLTEPDRLPELEREQPVGVAFWWTDGGPPRRLTARSERSGRVTVTESKPATGGAP